MKAATVFDATADLQQAATRLAELVRVQEVSNYAHAIQATTDRGRDGYMAHQTMRKHLESLWGTVEAKGLTGDVKRKLGIWAA